MHDAPRITDGGTVTHGGPDDLPRWESVRQLSLDAVPGWPAVLSALVATARTDAELAMVGAHPIEDLIREHGRQVIDELSALAHRDERLRRAIESVYLSDGLPADVVMTLETLRATSR